MAWKPIKLGPFTLESVQLTSKLQKPSLKDAEEASISCSTLNAATRSTPGPLEHPACGLHPTRHACPRRDESGSTSSVFSCQTDVQRVCNENGNRPCLTVFDRVSLYMCATVDTVFATVGHERCSCRYAS